MSVPDGFGAAAPAAPGRVLAIDFGTRRIGLALSDPNRIIAQPLGFVACGQPTDDVRRIVRLARQNEVTVLVIGLPLSMDGAPREAAAAARAFAARLHQASGLPVHEWDERLTSVAAERLLVAGGVRRQRRREVVDQTAACLVLQAYLDHDRGSAGQPADATAPAEEP